MEEADHSNCPYKINNLCQVSTDLAGLPVLAADDACAVCCTQPNARNINYVTCSKAIYTLLQAGKPVPDHLYKPIKDKVFKGPGTELKKLISWFVWNKKVKNCTTCKNRESRMNLWGPDGCEKNISTIVKWLEESANTHNLPFSKRIALAAIRKAIHRSRQI